jgi:hypothetical protein
VRDKFFFVEEKNLFFLRKTIVRPTQRLLQKLPIKPCTWVLFALGCHMFVARNVMQFVVLCDGGTQAAEGFVLRQLKRVAF